MENETKFGKLLFQCSTTFGKDFRKRLLYLVPALVFITAGIYAQRNPDLLEPDEITMVLGLFFGAGAFFLLLAVFFVKRSKAFLYEGGIVHTYASKVIEIDFNDVIGIRDLASKQMWFALILPIFALKSRDITIEKKDGTIIQLSKNKVADINKFADILNSVFTERLLKDVTKQNLSKTTISFGKELELKDGQLLYNDKTVIPFEEIIKIETGDGGHHIMLIGKEKESKKFTRTDIIAMIAVDKALNIEALYRIVQIAKEI